MNLDSQMTRIPLLFLLLLPTVLLALFKAEYLKTQCVDTNGLACIVEDSCYATTEGKMVQLKKDKEISNEEACNVRIMIKQYSKSSYFIRFITKANKIKWIRDEWTFFGCQLNEGKKSLMIESSNSIQLKMAVEYNENGKLTISNDLTFKMLSFFNDAKNKCDPGSIHFGGSDFKEGKYSLLPVSAHWKCQLP
ncbi:hypothetical protein PENTCL1PPCAC_6242 [Pristionchus entomophagus]|uniref:Uncharacterized protein n=1 Tax=Pristionchus entomophagus TaxID=358040 RepID=A0AAV5SMW0_9BILA|nr:hypothetical protein PENTCL1PPCAC_6242 [Pristionchus entomophagus]